MPRIVVAALVLALAIGAPDAPAQPAPTPEAAVEGYYTALAAADFHRVAELTHPAGVELIRRELLAAAEGGPALPTPLRERLGVRGTAEVQAMSPRELYRRLLEGFFPDTAALVAGMAGVTVSVRGVTPEPPELAHVLHSLTFPNPEGVVVRTATAVVGFDGGGWKVMPEPPPGGTISQTLGLPMVLFPFMPGGP